MKRCLWLAAQGQDRVAPNPLVGCVIVFDNEVIGEGFHEQYGGPHAEVNAINNVLNKEMLAQSTLVVNLEPCSHKGKTPPCADLIIKNKIKRVVIGAPDTNPLVAGKGIEKLRKAGIEVITDVLKDDCRQLNKRFYTYHENKRPYIILKWAKTLDGFISRKPPFKKEDNWITSPESKKLVHQWRAQEQAIMIGTNTAILDNPELTVRLTEGENPLRIVIDENLAIPFSHHVFSEDTRTLVFTALMAQDREHVHYIKTDFSRNILPFVMETLYERKVISVIIEGGAYLLNSFIKSGLWDEARIFTGSKEFGAGLPSPAIEGRESYTMTLAGDTLLVLSNPLTNFL
jgi:diaminohydroxyphosphoribosylaminopyrimidine deaminase/5-amino-6-(5-phosphoribosylamino)uracil reductase